jgi:putative ABC transport system ATP-binding protein
VNVLSLINVEKVTKLYYSKKEIILALDNVSLNVDKGEFLALVGPSGAGKSTLLYIIGGLEKPTKGNVYINGVCITNKNINDLTMLRRDKIGFIFQLFNLISFMSALDNVMLPMLMTNLSKQERFMRAKQLFEEVNLDKKMYRKVSELSVGEQQRVAIVRAMANKPLLVLADEPTANLDQDTGEKIINLMRKFNEKYNTTFIIATHDTSIINKVDRIIKIRDGKIIEDSKNIPNP